jgi:heme/copper-type cytochrome/quinol oxidase subunit 2
MTEAGGHGGHGSVSGPTPDEFRRLTEEFVARHRQRDGTVRVSDNAAHGAQPSPHDDGHGGHAGHGMPAAPEPVTLAATADVYLMAEQWSFEPAHLQLDVDRPYRFRMMAVDASHGASLQLGNGSQIIRLRRGIVVERELTFTRRGEYLLYCTVYCGAGHDRMSGKIIVA